MRPQPMSANRMRRPTIDSREGLAMPLAYPETARFRARAVQRIENGPPDARPLPRFGDSAVGRAGAGKVEAGHGLYRACEGSNVIRRIDHVFTLFEHVADT